MPEISAVRWPRTECSIDDGDPADAETLALLVRRKHDVAAAAGGR
jgi:hypothetical protein